MYYDIYLSYDLNGKDLHVVYLHPLAEHEGVAREVAMTIYGDNPIRVVAAQEGLLDRESVIKELSRR